jgi:hypothetical protein
MAARFLQNLVKIGIWLHSISSKHMRTRRRGAATVNSTRERGWCWKGQCNCLGMTQYGFGEVEFEMGDRACVDSCLWI